MLIIFILLLTLSYSYNIEDINDYTGEPICSADFCSNHHCTDYGHSTSRSIQCTCSDPGVKMLSCCNTTLQYNKINQIIACPYQDKIYPSGYITSGYFLYTPISDCYTSFNVSIIGVKTGVISSHLFASTDGYYKDPFTIHESLKEQIYFSYSSNYLYHDCGGAYLTLVVSQLVNN